MNGNPMTRRAWVSLAASAPVVAQTPPQPEEERQRAAILRNADELAKALSDSQTEPAFRFVP